MTILFSFGVSFLGAWRRFRFDNSHLFTLQPLVRFNLFVFHYLPFSEAPESVRVDIRVVDENILALFVDDKAEALFEVKPLYSSFTHKASP
jgi:hypothetical protein